MVNPAALKAPAYALAAKNAVLVLALKSAAAILEHGSMRLRILGETQTSLVLAGQAGEPMHQFGCPAYLPMRAAVDEPSPWTFNSRGARLLKAVTKRARDRGAVTMEEAPALSMVCPVCGNDAGQHSIDCKWL
jgi:hypothetical protein